MSSDRECFLDRVRKAVAEGNQAGSAVPLPERGTVGYQGGGADPLARFCAELTAAGGQAHVVPDGEAAVALVLALVRERGVRSVLLGREAFLDTLALAGALRKAGVEVVGVNSLTEGQQKEPFFAADLGLSGVDYLLAETGSVALRTRPDQPRSLSLLPPVHVAVARRDQIVADLFDLFEKRLGEHQDGLPACLSLITGPSKTGDIELRLVTGVHGPGEIHVVVVGTDLKSTPLLPIQGPPLQ
jgi:L-lactate dehydrogenase complex protein LldG